MTTTFEPWRLFCTDEAGLSLSAAPQSDPITTQPIVLSPGGSVLIDESIYRANVDALGRNFLDLDEDAQLARWGRVRFVRDSLPDHVKAKLDRDRRAQLEAQRAFLLQSNPHLHKRSGGLALLEAIEEELS